jgi:hypothetical protein
MQNRIAEAAVGPSALRNQGAPGVVGVARKCFKELDLGTFTVASERGFVQRLDASTENLRKRFPRGARNWGAARKALNLFLRDALYNTFLSKHYHLARLEAWLEIPLDRDVAAGLHSDSHGDRLPGWIGIKHLTPEVSRIYQEIAKLIADEKNIARIHLDLLYWRRDEDQ